MSKKDEGGPSRSARTYPNFGVDLEQLMSNAGLDDREVADVVGVHPDSVGRWRRGVTRPRSSTLRKLAGLLRVPIAQLRRDDKQHAHLSPVAPIAASTEEDGLTLQELIRQPGAKPRVVRILKRSEFGVFFLGLYPTDPRMTDDFEIFIEGNLDADLFGDM